MKVIKIIEFANGSHCPFAGYYVKAFNFEAFDGLGSGIFTRNACEAMRFCDVVEASAFWRRQSIIKPFRADGKPNRPLMAATVEISEAPHD